MARLPLANANVILDFANRTKTMTPVRNSSFTWPVMFAGIMVCSHWVTTTFQADKAIAHQQCARDAKALKLEDGESLVP